MASEKKVNSLTRKFWTGTCISRFTLNRPGEYYNSANRSGNFSWIAPVTLRLMVVPGGFIMAARITNDSRSFSSALCDIPAIKEAAGGKLPACDNK
jgi:hypothetical protein